MKRPAHWQEVPWRHVAELLKNCALRGSISRELADDLLLLVNVAAEGRLEELPAPDHCEHGILEGDWCEVCASEYRRARIENGDE